MQIAMQSFTHSRVFSPELLIFFLFSSSYFPPASLFLPPRDKEEDMCSPFFFIHPHHPHLRLELSMFLPSQEVVSPDV